MAEKLGIAQITYFEKLVDLVEKTIRVRRNVGNGWEILETRLPVLLTVIDTANEPRSAAAKRMMRFKRARSAGEILAQVAKENAEAGDEQKQAETAKRMEALRTAGTVIEQWDLDDIHADLNWCGLAGSPTKVHRVQSIVLTKEGFTAVAATEEAICSPNNWRTWSGIWSRHGMLLPNGPSASSLWMQPTVLGPILRRARGGRRSRKIVDSASSHADRFMKRSIFCDAPTVGGLLRKKMSRRSGPSLTNWLPV